MKKLLVLLIGLSLFVAFCIVGGCTSGHLSVDEAYSELRPVKQLELPDQVENNLIIVIDNVADESSSYKNSVVLFINDKRIDPNWLVSNVQDKYIYKLRIRPGYYEVRGKYNAYIGWGEDKYTIRTHDLIRVQHDKRTILKCTIVKKPNGEPVNKKMYFDVETTDLKANDVNLNVEQKQPVDRADDLVTLQINTVPEHAQIIIDDKVVGQSPLKYDIDPASDHIVQISAHGYKTFTKFIDHSKIGGKQVFHVIQELERLD